MKLKQWFRVWVLLLLALFAVQPLSAQDESALALADADGQFIDIDGVSIYYIARGEVGNPVVLLIHGFGGSTFTWRDNMDALVEAGYRVIAFDRPPYGLSAKTTEIDYTNEYYVELTAKLLDAWEIPSAVLVGHSAGGGVIAQFAIAYPERVDALVFVAGAVAVEGDDTMTATEEATDSQGEDEGDGGSPFGGFASALANLNPESPLAIAAVRALITPERFAELLTSAYYNTDVVTDKVIEGYGRALRVDGWEGAFLKLFSSPRASTPLARETLESFDFPTLILWGQEDTWVPLSAGERLYALIPGAELIVYPEVGHLPMEENVAAFNHDLVAWLTQR